MRINKTVNIRIHVFQDFFHTAYILISSCPHQCDFQYLHNAVRYVISAKVRIAVFVCSFHIDFVSGSAVLNTKTIRT